MGGLGLLGLRLSWVYIYDIFDRVRVGVGCCLISCSIVLFGVGRDLTVYCNLLNV
jgi:hypothetical protein